MSSPNPIVFPPPNWTNQDVKLYHGTIDVYAGAIVSGPVMVSSGKPNTDFGQGFYTSTLSRQAHTWAAQLAAAKGANPAVIEIVLRRDDLAELDTLGFVRGDFYADDFWSLVHYCRMGATDHQRKAPRAPYYDVVYGPVAAFWNQRLCIQDADQISFHTSRAETILNVGRRTRII